MPLDANLIVAQARTWLGTPFLHGQAAKGLGVDCGQFVVGVGRDLGLAIPDLPAYSESPDSGIFVEYLNAWCERVHERQPGDILWLSFAGEPRHVAISTDIGMIHAWAGGPRKVCEHRIDDVWLRRLRSVWRVR